MEEDKNMEQNKAKKHEGDPGKAVMKLDRDFQIGEITRGFTDRSSSISAERFTEAFMIPAILLQTTADSAGMSLS